MAKKKTQTDDSVVETGVQAFVCKCSVHAEKPHNLVLRPDLAGEADGHSKLALCIFAKPAAVHEWSQEVGDYVLREDLEFQNNQVVFKESGQVYASVTPPSLADMDTDDEAEVTEQQPSQQPGGSQPVADDHVDLEGDSYY